jgi:hypothetical protein
MISSNSKVMDYQAAVYAFVETLEAQDIVISFTQAVGSVHACTTSTGLPHGYSTQKQQRAWLDRV